MKTIVAGLLIALAFTTGFTCSKNAPQEAPPVEVAPAPTEVPAGTPDPAAAPAPGETAPPSTGH